MAYQTIREAFQLSIGAILWVVLDLLGLFQTRALPASQPYLPPEYNEPTMEDLPNIDQWLVTPENPPRVVAGLDYERCAALHNYIIQYAWVSSDRHISDFVRDSWLDKYHEDSEEFFEPSLVSFLKSAYDHEQTELSFFYWATGLNPPGQMWINWAPFQYEGEEYRYLTLYSAYADSHADGLCYDQKRHKAAMFMTLDDHGFGEGEEGEMLWFPLETVLSNWISMIRMGKVAAAPAGARPGDGVSSPWIYYSYSSQQVEDAIAAFNRLVVAIESRMPSIRPSAQDNAVMSSELLNAAGIKNPSFARSFLRSLRLPSFKFLAPGILVPSPETFVQNQLFTYAQSYRNVYPIPPVLLFPAAETFKFNSDDFYGRENPNPFGPWYVEALKDASIPAGVYSSALDRDASDTAEDGFLFILPYSIGENRFARKSDGTRLGKGNSKDLYQHGFKPFGGGWSREQRLVRLLDSWTKMVNDGLWEIGEDGVLGGIGKFREADTEENWRDYWIEVDW